MAFALSLALSLAPALAAEAAPSAPQPPARAKAPAGRSAKKPPAPAPARSGKGGSAKSKPAPSGKAGVSNKAPRKQGTVPGAADPGLRASIAGDEPASTKAEDSPELDAMKEVDDVLFPDVHAAATMVLPNHSLATGSVVSTGLPPKVDLGPATAQSPSDTTDFAWLAKLDKPDLPFRWDPRLVRYLDYFKNNPKGRSMVAALIKKSGRFSGSIQRALRAAHLPEDLVWLALIESGMNPRISSHAGAAGLWQFMPKAAAAYGLRIDRWVDERLDPERSTQAAVRYLGDLHTRFGRWELALAAYNMGHGGLLTAIRKYNTNDYWELSQLESGVPYETALYVPKIVALAFVAKNRAVFGCDGLELDKDESFDTVSVAPGISVQSIAGAAGTTPDKVRDLNPELLGSSIPPRGTSTASFTLRLPEGSGATASSKLPKLDSADLDRVTLRWGESLESVANARGTTESKIRALNGLASPVPPRPGSEVFVPRASSKVAPSTDPFVAVVPSQVQVRSDRRRIFYEVVWGDDLDGVARALGVTSDELCMWNNVDPTAKLHGKMVLQAFVPKEKNLADVRFVESKNARLLTLGSPEFFDYFESKNGRSRLSVTVKKGETWQSIARRYGLTLGQLERINQRSHYAALSEGEQLVVYTRRNDTPASKTTKPDDTLYDSAPDLDDAPRASGLVDPTAP